MKVTPILDVIPEKRIVIFSPHYDDVLLMLGGYIHQLENTERAQKQWEIKLIYSRSNYQQGGGTANYDTSTARIQYATGIRQIEDVQCIDELLGRHQYKYELLGEDEALVRGFKLPNDGMEFPHGTFDHFRVQERGIFKRMSDHIATYLQVPDIALVFPLAIREHIDHFIVREAAIDALSKAENSTASVYFQEDKPYAGLAQVNDRYRTMQFINNHKLTPIYFTYDFNRMVAQFNRHYPSQSEPIYGEGIQARALELQSNLAYQTPLDCIWKMGKIT